VNPPAPVLDRADEAVTPDAQHCRPPESPPDSFPTLRSGASLMTCVKWRRGRSRWS